MIAALIFLFNNPLDAKAFYNRALWVVRDHIITKKSADDIIAFAETNDYNILFIQIRGRGDAYYSSKIVPRTHLLKETDFDPLQYILRKSKDRDLQIHAWMNVYYLWSSYEKPKQNDHALLNHHEWLDNKTPDYMDVPQMLSLMKKNKKINGEGFYLAPTHPEVDAHLQNVITELLQNYQLDGIHFDYIRYHAAGWGMNPTGLKLFLNQSSAMPGLPSLDLQNKPNFSEFKKLDSLKDSVKEALSDVINLTSKLTNTKKNLPDKLPNNPIDLSFWIGAHLGGPVAEEQQRLLEEKNTFNRLQREYEMLDHTRKQLAARTALKESFPDIKEN